MWFGNQVANDHGLLKLGIQAEVTDAREGGIGIYIYTLMKC